LYVFYFLAIVLTVSIVVFRNAVLVQSGDKDRPMVVMLQPNNLNASTSPLRQYRVMTATPEKLANLQVAANPSISPIKVYSNK
jgi:hypothetical protein